MTESDFEKTSEFRHNIVNVLMYLSHQSFTEKIKKNGVDANVIANAYTALAILYEQVDSKGRQ